MKFLTIAYLLFVQYQYEYPGPPMGTWRDPCSYGPGPDCPGHPHPEGPMGPVPMPRPRPHFGPGMEDCIYRGYCGPQRPPVEGPPDMPPFPDE